MKKLLFFSVATIVLISACSKGSSSPTDNNNNASIQKQIVNIKWYYDSTVVYHEGFKSYQDYDPQTYIFFGEDSTMTEFNWTGLTYDKTDYPFVFESDNRIHCDYFFGINAPVIKNNILTIGDVFTPPSQTDTTGQVEIIWYYYHK